MRGEGRKWLGFYVTVVCDSVPQLLAWPPARALVWKDGTWWLWVLTGNYPRTPAPSRALGACDFPPCPQLSLLQFFFL
jgi:hypothetical protein